MALGRRTWTPGPLRCCSCDRALDVRRQGDAANAGAAVLPDVPGAVCDACLAHVEGLAVADLRVPAAVHMLQTGDFEVRTADAAQFFLDLFGWEPAVVAAAALRLHADGKPRDAYHLLAAAASAAPSAARYLAVERAALLLLDGETGKAHDLLAATTEDDHPCWHLHHGALAHSVGRPDAAAGHWRRQVEIRPEEPLGWQTLGFYLLQERDDAAAAEAVYRQACTAFPRHQEFRAWLGEAIHRQGRPQEALAELEAARALEPIDQTFTDGLEQLIRQIRNREGTA